MIRQDMKVSIPIRFDLNRWTHRLTCCMLCFHPDTVRFELSAAVNEGRLVCFHPDTVRFECYYAMKPRLTTGFHPDTVRFE